MAAKQRQNKNLMISIHTQNVPKTIQESKSNRAGLIIQHKNFVKSVGHKLTGFIHKDFNAVLMNYGQGFTGKQMS